MKDTKQVSVDKRNSTINGHGERERTRPNFFLAKPQKAKEHSQQDKMCREQSLEVHKRVCRTRTSSGEKKRRRGKCLLTCKLLHEP